jgi:hypothetical protein
MSRSGRRSADDVLLKALACGATVETAARTAGVSESTVYRRKRDPKFNQRLLDLLEETAGRTKNMLNAIGPESVKNLAALQKETAPYPTRLGAVRTALELGLKYSEAGEFRERLAAVERLLKAVTKPAKRIILPGES